MFSDRDEAGRVLSQLVLGADAICAIPRGGVPVAAPIARKLGVPLGIVAVKKIASPADPEFALGAAGGDLVDAADGTPRVWIDSAREKARRLEERFGTIDVSGRNVVIVDDGAATGRTVVLAVRIVRARGASKVTVALPIASVEAADAIRRVADAALILEKPEGFAALSAFYERFDQLTDDDVDRILSSVSGIDRV